MAHLPEDTKFHLPGFTLPLDFIPGPPPATNVPHAAKSGPKDKLFVGSGKRLFPTALTADVRGDFDKHELDLVTLRELNMLAIMGHITDKPNWEVKLLDPEIVQKWRDEVIQMYGDNVADDDKAEGEDGGDGEAEAEDEDKGEGGAEGEGELEHGNDEEADDDEEMEEDGEDGEEADDDDGMEEAGPELFVGFSEKMLDWVFEELRFKAKVLQETGTVTVFDEGVVKSDTAVPESLRQALIAGVARLEDVPEDEKDWHPNSDNQVLDLVHPSLFPLVYGRTRIIRDKLLTIDDGINLSGAGEAPPIQSRGSYDNTLSEKFQWLPCDVSFVPSKHGSFKCRITSYINNLHPKDHADLYRVIEGILDCAVPLWNVTLTGLKLGPKQNRIKYKDVTYDPDPENMPDSERPPQEADEDEDDYWDRIWEWEKSVRKVVQPEPGEFQHPFVPKYKFLEGEADTSRILTPEQTVDLYRDYQGMQVIVKLANIHLTPEKPNYPGGSWHVEGQLNERICATAIYYYDCENINDSHLGFRRELDNSYVYISYPQNHDEWLWDVFGLGAEDSTIQDLGSVLSKQGRLITFPNSLQHRVQPFSLADPTKPGHRKILALFLVDPNIRVISTAHVPAQRRDWWERIVPWNNILGRLPAELQIQVASQIDDFPLSMEEAKKLRLELMAERTGFVRQFNDKLERSTFSLCEH